MIVLDFKRNGKKDRNKSIHRKTNDGVAGLPGGWESFTVGQTFDMHREFIEKFVD